MALPKDTTQGNRSSRYIIFAFIVVALAVLLILTTGQLGGPRVTETYPGDNSHFSALGRIGISFSEPMLPESVEQYFGIDPDVDGEFLWEGDTVWFKPEHPLEPGASYSVEVKRYALSLNGQRLRRDTHFTITVRQPEVVYLRVGERGGDLYTIGLNQEKIFRLTSTGGKVYDYRVSPDGEWVVFSAENDQLGRDLWLVNRNGRTRRVLVSCGSERCQSPDWKPDGKFVAYSREGVFDEKKQVRIFTVAFPAGESIPLESADEQQGEFPQWSPDGTRLAYYDPQNQAIRIRDMQTGKEVAVESAITAVGCWSPDSQIMFYSSVVEGEESPNSYPIRVDAGTGQITPLTIEEGEDLEYGMPACDPNGQWLIIGARHPGSPPSRQMWLLRTDGTEMQPVTDNPLFSHAAFRWDPWGRSVVFQQLRLGSSENTPSVVIWQKDTGTFTELAEDAGLPQWIP